LTLLLQCCVSSGVRNKLWETFKNMVWCWHPSVFKKWHQSVRL
jgi:hypothetical protein